ncbi:MAG: hypothetical protein U1E59_14845 [Amaricoccus sp.]
MPAPTPDRPRLPLDPLLARKALGEVRNAMRAGFGLVRDTVDRAPLPTPVAAVAGTVLRRVDDLAHQADAAASTVVHGFLTAAGIALNDPEERDAAALAAGLRRAVTALDAPGLRVGETAVRGALRSARRDAAGESDVVRAAALTRHLLEAEALRAPSAELAARAPVAVFAAVLAHLQASGDPAEVTASAALADALADEIRAVADDRAALARLFAEFRDHV